jgi:hypothetical protein
VPPGDEPELLKRARVYEGLPYLDGIGFLFDRGSYWEVDYEGCDHCGAFPRDRTNYDFAHAADFARKEMASCGTCASHARLARILADDHPAA